MMDHIVYGVPDLDAGVDEVERRLGVRAAPGGRHAGAGTHNALLGLGGATYLEIIALDPDRAPGARPSFGLEALTEPRLVGWAMRAADLDALVVRSRAAGFDPGDVHPLGRTRPDGVRLDWRLTRAPEGGPGFTVPFLIDWMDAQHPSETSPQGVTLASFRVVHPAPESIQAALDALGAGIVVERGPAPALIAALDGPAGRAELR